MKEILVERLGDETQDCVYGRPLLVYNIPSVSDMATLYAFAEPTLRPGFDGALADRLLDETLSRPFSG